MKENLLQIRIDTPTLTALKAVSERDAEMTASQFVREAIREKLARNKPRRKRSTIKVAA